MIEDGRELLAPRSDVWAVLAEPYHLPDWWPGYQGVEPDRRGLAPGARWQIMRGARPGLLRRPKGEGLIVIEKVVEGSALAWKDVQQGLGVLVTIESRGAERTWATVAVDGSWWRLVAEGGRSLPRESLARLHALCQTAASL